MTDQPNNFKTTDAERKTNHEIKQKSLLMAGSMGLLSCDSHRHYCLAPIDMAKNYTYAYIDGANLHRGIKELGWHLDYRRFRIFLQDRYAVEVAYLFLGFISYNSAMYHDLEAAGFVLVFKPTIFNAAGEVKGNCDAEMVLRATSDFYEHQCNQAVIVTGDGDFACLASFLKAQQGLRTVISPNHKKCSLLLKRSGAPITFLEEFREMLEGEAK